MEHTRRGGWRTLRGGCQTTFGSCFCSAKVTGKRHRGEPGHTRDTRDTRAHAGTRITRTTLTTIHPNPPTQIPARKPHGPRRSHPDEPKVTGKNTPGGAGTHTGHTSAHADTRRTQTNLTSIRTHRLTRTTTQRLCVQRCISPLWGLLGALGGAPLGDETRRHIAVHARYVTLDTGGDRSF